MQVPMLPGGTFRESSRDTTWTAAIVVARVCKAHAGRCALRGIEAIPGAQQQPSMLEVEAEAATHREYRVATEAH